MDLFCTVLADLDYCFEGVLGGWGTVYWVVVVIWLLGVLGVVVCKAYLGEVGDCLG